MISKELLSEVMRKQIGGDEECKDIKIINNVLYFTAFYKHKINIYELANKCKEWANSLSPKRYQLYSAIAPSRLGYATCEVYSGAIQQGKEIQADTEAGAIFQACEWILETVSTDTKEEEDGK